MIRRLCVIGLGLIGGSVARAARERGLAKEIVGADTDRTNLSEALKSGVIDHGSEDSAAAAREVDFVLIAVPVGAFRSVLRQLAKVWSDSAVYTDAGSTKTNVVAAARDCFGAMPHNFVPGHPIAGAERSGVGASSADLYVGKRVIVTPNDENDPASIELVASFWTACGAKVSTMDAPYHDAVFAATSHLPHVLAFALVHLLAQKDEQAELFQYAAGGFRDFTRIASSDPTMWLDICLANRGHLLPLINQYQAELAAFSQLLNNGRDSEIFEFLASARNARERYLTSMEN